jgi:hypothetical protein
LERSSLTGDRLIFKHSDGKDTTTLYDLLSTELEICTISSLIEIWDNAKAIDGDGKHISFLKSLNLLNEENKDLTQLQYLFAHIIYKGRSLHNQFGSTNKEQLGSRPSE